MAATATRKALAIVGATAFVLALAIALLRDDGRDCVLAPDAPTPLAERSHETATGDRKNAADRTVRTAPFDPATEPVTRSGSGLHLTGRFVDDDRFPLAGVEVKGATAGVETVTAATDSNGNFDFWLPEPDRTDDAYIQVFATDGRGHGRILYWRLEPRGAPFWDFGTLALRNLRPFTIRVTSGNDAVAGASIRVATELHTLFTGSERSAFLSGATDSAGLFQFAWAYDDSPCVHVRARDGRCATRVLGESDGTDTCVFDLEPVAPLTVRVISSKGGAPIPGVTLYAGRGDVASLRSSGYWFSSGVPTDATGTARIDGVPASWPVSVRILRAPGWVAPEAQEWFDLGKERSLTVKLDPSPDELGARWPIDTTGGAPPPDGSACRISVEHPSNPAARVLAAHVEGEFLVCETFERGEGWGTAGVATAADGRQAVVAHTDWQSTGEPVRFVAPARVIAKVVAEGHPVPGVIVLRDASDSSPSWGITDAAGTVIFESTFPRPCSISVRPAALALRAPPTDEDVPPGGTRSLQVAQAPLLPRLGDRCVTVNPVTAPETTVTIDLGVRVDTTVHVTVDGKPRLPADFEFLPDDPVTFATDWSEDPASGTLHFSWWIPPEGSIPAVTCTGGDLPPAMFPERPIPPDRKLRFDVGIGAAAKVAIAVTLPSSRAVDLVLCQLESGPSAPHGAKFGPMSRPMIDDTSSAHFRAEWADLPLGRYRAFETTTGTPGPLLDLTSPATTVEVSWDLSHIFFVEGRVIVPDGEALIDTQVAWSVEDPALPVLCGATELKGTGSVDEAGMFSMQIRGDRPVELTVIHPTLRPDPQRGHVVVRGPRQNLQLELVRAPRATMTIRGADVAPASPPSVAGDVTLTVPGAAADSAFTTPLIQTKDGYCFGGYEPGVYDIAVAVSGHVPVLLRGVELPRGRDADVGIVRVVRNGSLRVTIERVDCPADAELELELVPITQHVPMRIETVNPSTPACLVPSLAPGDWQLRLGPTEGRPSWTIRQSITIKSGEETRITYRR